jgi:hypothetical protein
LENDNEDLDEADDMDGDEENQLSLSNQSGTGTSNRAPSDSKLYNFEKGVGKN